MARAVPKQGGKCDNPIRARLKRRQGTDFNQWPVKCQGPELAESTLPQIILTITILLLFVCSLHQPRRLRTESSSSSDFLAVPHHHDYSFCIFPTPVSKMFDCIKPILLFPCSPHQPQRHPTESSSSFHVPYHHHHPLCTFPTPPSKTFDCIILLLLLLLLFACSLHQRSRLLSSTPALINPLVCCVGPKMPTSNLGRSISVGWLMVELSRTLYSPCLQLSHRHLQPPREDSHSHHAPAVQAPFGAQR